MPGPTTVTTIGQAYYCIFAHYYSGPVLDDRVLLAGAFAAAYSRMISKVVALLANTQSAALLHALVLVIVALYCSALGRAWVVTGISRRG